MEDKNYTFNFRGNDIEFSLRGDGKGSMINATEMAKPFGKTPKDWLRTNQSREFIEAISDIVKIPVIDLVLVTKGGNDQGTWMHEYVAIEFAKWLSKKDCYFGLINSLKEYYLNQSGNVIIKYDKEEINDFLYNIIDNINKDILLNFKIINSSADLCITCEFSKLKFNIPLENYSISLSKEDILILTSEIYNSKLIIDTINFLDRFTEINNYSYIRLKYLILSNLLSSIYENNNFEILNNKQKTYLMKDSNTGYTKIGKAVNPKFRERTLQSEKPSISLFSICDSLIESELHREYKNKRVRGEWFNLTESEINNIINKYNFNRI